MLTPHQQRARQYTVAATAINAFAVDAYSRLTPNRGNILFSPISVYEALGLAFAGAGGQTAGQMAEVLRWGIDRRDAPPTAVIGADEIPFPDLVIANGIWAQCGYPIRQTYIDRVARADRGELFEVNFLQAPELARQTINAWIDGKTRGKIQDFAPPGAVNELTRLMVTNAVYLDAAWAEKFDPADTNPAPFHLAAGGDVAVNMMHQTTEFAAVEEDRFLMVHLPYQSFRTSMQIYLPRDPADIGWLEQMLLTTGPDHWQREMSPHTVVLSLPRFRLTAEMTLGSILREMGMPDAFDGSSADFSGIAPAVYNNSGAVGAVFFLSETLQKTFVEIDEVGTRAAAASGSILCTGWAPTPPRLVVNVNHPFLFTICAHSPLYRAPTLLFMGRVMDPTTALPLAGQ